MDEHVERNYGYQSFFIGAGRETIAAIVAEGACAKYIADGRKM